MGWRSRARRAVRAARKLVRVQRELRGRIRELRSVGHIVVGANVGYSRIGPVVRLAIGVGTPEAEGEAADVTTVAFALPIPRELAESLQQALPEEGLKLSRRLVKKPSDSENA